MQYNAVLFVPLILASLVSGETSHPLHGRLHTWQTIKEGDLYFHRQKRSLDAEKELPTLDKQISFNVFERTFTLSLMPSTEVFAPGFKAYVTSQYDTHKIDVDKSTVMKGVVLGDAQSSVTAHMHDNLLTANIVTKNETFIVEPLWRHLPQPQKVSSGKCTQCRDLLVYRESDIIKEHLLHPHKKGGFCDTEKLMKEFWNKNENVKNNKSREQKHTDRSVHSRQKRAAGNKKICKISLVADFRFYREMGNSSVLETMYYLINLIDRVNKIYKKTNWDASGETMYTGYGFQIGEITIHNDTTFTESTRYNMDQLWGAKDLLEAFSEDNRSVCLSHLFTYVDFENGLLGLAYVGSEKVDNVGGICTKPYRPSRSPKPLYLNTGLTSTVNWGQKILTTEADLVTAHELGHNFGAEHDDGHGSGYTADSCTPGQANNGNYIMYPAAVSGQYPNNNRFSDCSKHNIMPSLLKKAPICFHEDKNSFCGNYQVEEHDNETCDVGYITGMANADRCCFSNCTLKPGAKCSNKNYPCCTEDCQAESTSKMCRAHIPGLCWKDAYCDGKSFYCPQAEPVPDNTTCGDNGKCKNGVCQPFCVTKGKQPCLCTQNKEHFCLRCCAPLNATGEAMTEKCTPYIEPGTKGFLKLLDNATCTLGYCQNGVCNKQTQDVIERVWDIFKHIAPDKIGEFLADNIVGTVLVFSLLFWIPCGCLVNFVDKKRMKERQKEERWFNEKAGGDANFSRAFRGVGAGSAPPTPRIRIQRTGANWTGGNMAMRSGIGAREQWRASQERGLVIRKSHENLTEGPAPTATVNGAKPVRPREINVEPLYRRPKVISPSRSHPSLTSSLDDKSFEGEVKPIAASSTTDIPTAVLNADRDDTADEGDNGHALPVRRKFLLRQEALVSPVLKDTCV
uniref:ADAM 17-like protease n=1 Tax=Phallusia mammillata TaxID=59560 RepID=A0A6F9D5M2_9ASCI|nr:ADAM 17-like protease [Phallusia mammillata]